MNEFLRYYYALFAAYCFDPPAFAYSLKLFEVTYYGPAWALLLVIL